ncbi:CLUMA_CG013620, isoform A [Clunio marinus]|uniref:Dynein axonemal light chain 1 n=1 Tax=Clunio marinus TaxID=568069 RepID=A0A1J1IJE1_9DIPT|nr:CLUMA_CG013620, isoform A [Clunio marinus]
MSKATTIKEALQKWEERNEHSAQNAVEVGLQFQYPPIDRMTNDLAVLENCEKLSLSTNCITQIILSPSMRNLKILALGRNNIKSFSGLEVVSESLEQLWISYNKIDKMKGIEQMKKLKILYMAHNLIREWTEVSKLAALRDSLEDLKMVGNPITENIDEETYRSEMVHRLNFLKKLDGEPITELNEEI